MSSYLNYDGLVRVANKINTKFEAIATTTEEHADKILNLETNSVTKEELKQSVSTAVSEMIDQAPETLDTLNELAAALGDDPNFATTVAAEIGKKVDQSSYDNFVGSVTSSIGSINEEIDSLQEASEQHLNKTDYLGPVVMEGNPITYDNGIEGFDIKVETTFGPKQTGSGDPYPAGGGRNKLVFNSTGRSIDGIDFIANPADGSVTVRGTTTTSNVFANLNYVNSTTSLLPPGNYIVSGGTEKVRVEVIINDSVAYRSTGNHVNFTIPENVTNSWVRVQINATGTQVDTVVYPMVRLATDTDESYAPPSNIRPITGYDKLSLNHTGKNLLQNAASTQTKNGVTFTVNPDGSMTVKGTATANTTISIAGSSTNYSYMLPAGEYALSGCKGGKKDTYFIKLRSAELNPVAITIDDEERFTHDGSPLWCYIYVYAGVSVDETVYPMVRPGTVADNAYEPYRGNTYAVQIDQTVYGGKINWNTGKLIADRAMTTLTGTEEWNASTTNTTGKSRFYASGIATGVLPPPDSNTVAEGLACSHYKAAPSTLNGTYRCVQSIGIYTTGATYFYDDRYAEGTADNWKTYVAAQYAAGTPIQFTYKLKTPIEIQLTPTQISELENINTLYGDGDNIRAIFKSTGGTSTTLETISGILPVEKGGTGATSAVGARSNLGITPANIGALSTSGGTLSGTLTINRNDANSAMYIVNRDIEGTSYKLASTINSDKTGYIGYTINGTTSNYLSFSDTNTRLGKPLAVNSGGTGATKVTDALTNLGIPDFNKMARTSLGSFAGKTVGDLRTALKNWIDTVRDVPNATANFACDRTTMINYWNAENLTTALEAGSQMLVTLESYYTSAGYALLKFSTYYDKNIFYMVYNNSSWGTIQQIAFTHTTYQADTSRTANTVLAAPNGSNGNATFRALVAADIPNLAASKITSGTLAIARGGTGATDAAAARTSLGITPANIGAAPTSHASTATTYGAASASNYGHAMASSTTPKANGTAAVGSETAKFARGDHVHPLQTSVTGSSGSCTGNAASASKIAVTDTTPTTGTTYFPLYVTGRSGNQTVRANEHFYYYDTGSESYICVGNTSQLGGITLRQTNGYYINIIPGTLTANRNIYLPDVNGTVLTTGNLSYTDGSSSAGTIGTLKINSSSYTLKERVLNGTGTSLSGASITDLNTIKTPSVYYSGSSTTSATLTNAPWTSSGFRLITFAGYGGDSSYGLQVAAASSMLFWRNMGGSNADPSPWYVVPQIPYTGNKIGSSTTPIYMDSNGKMIACTSPSILVNLDSTAAANVFAASPRPGVTGTLAVENGGTNASSKSGARTNLGITSGTSLPASAAEGDIFFLYS